MTDAEIDVLDGIELRKAVADAVGWKWSESLGWAIERDLFGGIAAYRFLMSMNDLIEACRFIGFLDHGYQVTLGEGFTCIEKWNGTEWHRLGDAVGMDYKSLSRALLKAIAARK